MNQKIYNSSPGGPTPPSITTNDTGKEQPGRRLDALVAEVLGINFIRKRVGIGHYDREILLLVDDYCKCDICVRDGNTEMIHGPLMHGMTYPEVRPYSTDIHAAWEVVKKLKCSLNLYSPGINQREWPLSVQLWTAEFTDEKSDIYIFTWRGHADTASHAICLAALKTKEQDNVQPINSD